MNFTQRKVGTNKYILSYKRSKTYWNYQKEGHYYQTFTTTKEVLPLPLQQVSTWQEVCGMKQSQCPLVAHLQLITFISLTRFGPRFPAVSQAYDIELRQLALQVAKELEFNFVREGVYIIQSGPCFETVTECKLMKLLGADVTGISNFHYFI